jgi:antiviral helicase SLH1
MCGATEFDELPVRHNEDLINMELSKNLPLDATPLALPMWDPHVKAYLLLQSYMSQIDLPISDYVGDQNSVLDQSIRIIQASIDVFTELGYLSTCCMMITLLQCIKSARWPDDGPMSIFPGVDVDAERQRAQVEDRPPKTLCELTELSKPALTDLLLGLDVPRHLQTQAQTVADYLPILKITVTAISALGLTVGVSRENLPLQSQQPEVRVWAPRFPKPQSEGFFIIITEQGADEVLALKRVSWGEELVTASDSRAHGRSSSSKGSQARTTRAVFRLAPDKVTRRVEILVLSDAYIGMVWRAGAFDVPGAPYTRDDDGKGKGRERAEIDNAEVT